MRNALVVILATLNLFYINALRTEAQDGPYSKAQTTKRDRPRKQVVTSPPVTVEGEIVDAWCYASGTMGPGRGPSHKACAYACIAGGITPGIIEDKTGVLWIAAKYKGYQGCREILLPWVARHVRVQGWAAHIGSSNLLKIKSIQLLDGDDAGKIVVPEPPKPPVIEPSQSDTGKKVDAGSKADAIAKVRKP